MLRKTLASKAVHCSLSGVEAWANLMGLWPSSLRLLRQQGVAGSNPLRLISCFTALALEMCDAPFPVGPCRVHRATPTRAELLQYGPTRTAYGASVVYAS